MIDLEDKFDAFWDNASPDFKERINRRTARQVFMSGATVMWNIFSTASNEEIKQVQKQLTSIRRQILKEQERIALRRKMENNDE